VYTIGYIALAVYVFVGVVLKCSQREKPWAQKALPGLSTALFLLYPSFSAEFFDVLKCWFIDGQKYVSADLSIECSGFSSEYSALRAFAIFWVLFWACGLPLVTFALLRPVRSELRQFQKGDQSLGSSSTSRISIHRTNLPIGIWYFEVVEYAKKLLLIGIIRSIKATWSAPQSQCYLSMCIWQCC
jgi:hypothetical protein